MLLVAACRPADSWTLLEAGERTNGYTRQHQVSQRASKRLLVRRTAANNNNDDDDDDDADDDGGAAVYVDEKSQDDRS